MSMLFQRLHARAHGGPNVLPSLRPVAPLYGAQPDAVPTTDADAAAMGPAEDRSAAAGLTRHDAPAIVAATAAPSLPSGVRAEISSLPPETQPPAPPALESQAALRSTSASRSLAATEVRAAPPSVADDREPSSPQRRARAKAAAVAEPQPPETVRRGPQRAPPADIAASPPTAMPPLERLFAALETPPTPRAADAPPVSTAVPAVSIGRIDIIVAPPPAAPRAAPARTQGFANYAGIRRGLER